MNKTKEQTIKENQDRKIKQKNHNLTYDILKESTMRKGRKNRK